MCCQVLYKTFTNVNICAIGNSDTHILLRKHCSMEVRKKSRKLKSSDEADDYQVHSDGLRILAKIIARSYGRQSLPQETKTVIDNPSHDQQIA